MRIAYLLIAIGAVIVAGCYSLPSGVVVSPEQQAVNYATYKVIGEDPNRANRVIELVREARAHVQSGETVTVGALYEGVRDRINWQSLDPADRILIEAVLVTARDRLKNHIAAGMLNPEQRYKLLTVLEWIEGAASGFTSANP